MCVGVQTGPPWICSHTVCQGAASAECLQMLSQLADDSQIYIYIATIHPDASGTEISCPGLILLPVSLPSELVF
jgi:hypothetical protein